LVLVIVKLDHDSLLTVDFFSCLLVLPVGEIKMYILLPRVFTNNNGYFLFQRVSVVMESVSCCMTFVSWEPAGLSGLFVVIFTAQCYAGRRISTAVVCPFVCTFVRLSIFGGGLLNCDHVGWSFSKIILQLVSLGCSHSADHNVMDIL